MTKRLLNNICDIAFSLLFDDVTESRNHVTFKPILINCHISYHSRLTSSTFYIINIPVINRSFSHFSVFKLILLTPRLVWQMVWVVLNINLNGLKTMQCYTTYKYTCWQLCRATTYKSTCWQLCRATTYKST